MIGGAVFRHGADAGFQMGSSVRSRFDAFEPVHRRLRRQSHEQVDADIAGPKETVGLAGLDAHIGPMPNIG